MLTRDTRITISYPNDPETPDQETSWGDFLDVNEQDTIDEVLPQLEACNYAQLGGGAAELVWIFC